MLLWVKYLFFIGIIVLVSSCDNLEIDNKDKDQKDPQGNLRLEKSVINSDEFENNIIYSVVGGEAKKYSVQFQWPRLADKSSIRVRLGNVLSEVSNEQTFFTHTVSHRQLLNYSFDILGPDKRLLRTVVKQVLVPTDYVVDDASYLINEKTSINVNRLFISGDYALTTFGNDIEISANEVISSGGVIQNFPEDGRKNNVDESYEPNGTNGGSIQLIAKTLRGRLQIKLKGETGKTGDKGPPHTEIKSGRGVAASGGVYHCTPPGGNGEVYLLNNRSCWCHKYGENGGIGLTGSRGFQGLAGGKGGRSGNVRVEIETYLPSEGMDSSYDPETFRPVTISILGGQGGKGGAGGDGQLGSLGGEGRDPNGYLDCRGVEGPPGLRGDQGPEGPVGPVGDVGLSCLYIRSENINECN